MSKLKVFIAALIFGLGGTGAYLIVSNANKPALISNPNLTGNNPVGLQVATANAAINLSEIVGQKITDSISNANTDGLINSNGKTYIAAPNPEDITKDLLAEVEKNFDPASLRPVIKEADLKISEDNSREAIINYFKNFNNIVINASQKMPKSLADVINGTGDFQISDFAQIQNAYEYEINNFYSLSVPSTIVNIHKKTIELLTIKKNIFEKLANSEKDPITALVVLKEIPKTDLEFDALNSAKADYINSQFILPK